MIDNPLPELWTQVKLEDVAQLIGGGTPSRSNKQYFVGNIPWATPTDVTALNSLYIDKTTEYITKDGLRNSSARLLPVGTVLMTSRATIASTAIAQKEMCTNQGFANFVCDEKLIFNEYLAYWLPAVKTWLYQLAGGTTFKEISRSTLAKVQIPLPPLPEQERIVAILRQADDLRRQQQAALQEVQKLIPAIFHEMFGDPDDWNDIIPLKNLVEFVGGGTPSRKIEEYFTGEIPWATSKDIKSRYLLDTEEHITQEAVDNSSTKLVSAGSILLVVKSKILMHSLPMGITVRPFCFGQDLKGLVPIKGSSPQFIVAALQAQTRYILSRSRGVNTEGLTLSSLRNIPIPNISKTQQEEFAASVAVADRLIEQNTTNLLQIKLLFESLLTSAFVGNLTTKWREANLIELALAASNRDILSDHSIKSLLELPTGSGKTEAALMYIFWYRKELKNTFSELQRRLLLSITKFGETYFTPQSVKAQGGLQDLSLNAITRTFDLFEKLGLLVRVSLPVAPAGVEYAYFETFFRRPTPVDQGLETATESGA